MSVEINRPFGYPTVSQPSQVISKSTETTDIEKQGFLRSSTAVLLMIVLSYVNQQWAENTIQ